MPLRVIVVPNLEIEPRPNGRYLARHRPLEAPWNGRIGSAVEPDGNAATVAVSFCCADCSSRGRLGIEVALSIS